MLAITRVATGARGAGVLSGLLKKEERCLIRNSSLVVGTLVQVASALEPADGIESVESAQSWKVERYSWVIGRSTDINDSVHVRLHIHMTA